MTYFLDFDRTLFDTDAYNRSLLDRPALLDIRSPLEELLNTGRDETLTGGIVRSELWQKVSERLTEGSLTFAPGELSSFVYADVTEFLRMLGNEAIIITYGEKTRQKVKIENGLAGVVRLTVLYTEDLLKADYLQKYSHLVPGEGIFVDDRAVELEGVANAFPHLRLFEMRRDGEAGDGRWPVVRSLTELP